MGLSTFVVKVINAAQVKLADPVFRARALNVAVMLMVFTVCMTASADAGQFASGLKTNVRPWIKIGIRLFGAMIAIGGFVVAFNGFTGRDEGFEKVFKIGMGFIGVALGVLCAANPEIVITMLSIDSAFSAT